MSFLRTSSEFNYLLETVRPVTNLQFTLMGVDGVLKGVFHQTVRPAQTQPSIKHNSPSKMLMRVFLLKQDTRSKTTAHQRFKLAQTKPSIKQNFLSNTTAHQSTVTQNKSAHQRIKHNRSGLGTMDPKRIRRIPAQNQPSIKHNRTLAQTQPAQTITKPRIKGTNQLKQN